MRSLGNTATLNIGSPVLEVIAVGLQRSNGGPTRQTVMASDSDFGQSGLQRHSMLIYAHLRSDC
jgi:hypothetical protein